jgi:hypothetical protein
MQRYVRMFVTDEMGGIWKEWADVSEGNNILAFCWRYGKYHETGLVMYGPEFESEPSRIWGNVK